MSTATSRKDIIAPIYDPNSPAVKTIHDIEKILPHRYPFLLVDKIVEMTETYIVGIKNVTINEPFFQGHFPSNPVMPGVLQLEAMAQCGGILAINSQEPGTAFDTYFLKIDNAKFKAMVIPGDTLIMKLEFNGPIRRGICDMHGTAFVGSKMVCEADLMAQIVKR
jgi:UDP-3-O-[3-hydroxymyristoyl] N-acetylglucosamine deacetylase / 3-hydroxyacyl-[acyl-carrier-protein] dehydratase